MGTSCHAGSSGCVLSVLLWRSRLSSRRLHARPGAVCAGIQRQALGALEADGDSMRGQDARTHTPGEALIGAAHSLPAWRRQACPAATSMQQACMDPDVSSRRTREGCGRFMVPSNWKPAIQLRSSSPMTASMCCTCSRSVSKLACAQLGWSARADSRFVPPAAGAYPVLSFSQASRTMLDPHS